MRPEIQRVFQFFDHPDKGIDSYARRLLEYQTELELASLTKELQEICQECGVQQFCHQGYYQFLLGVAYLEQSLHSQAAECLDVVSGSLQGQGDFYHRALALILLGMTYEERQQTLRAYRTYQKAQDQLERWAILNGWRRDARYGRIKGILQARLETLSGSLALRAPSDSKARPWSPYRRPGYIEWRAFPVYGQVQSGVNGPIWVPSSYRSFAAVDEILLDGQRFSLYSIMPGDHQVTLNPAYQYGWARVQGNSMNRARPVPIEGNDWVLFRLIEDAEANSIVIVSCPEAHGSGYRFMVKRLSGDAKTFLSETTAGEEHLPLPRDREHVILGVVIAVAKPMV